MRLRESTLAVLFLIPAFIALGVFLYYPIAQTFIYSLYNLRYTTELTPEAFYGLNNYINVLNSGPFWSSLGFTLYFTVMAVFFEFWLGFAFALASFRVVPALRGPLRAIIIIPWAIPPIIHAALFRWLYNTDVGLFGTLLVDLGLTDRAPLFLGNPTLAMHSVIFAYVWKSAAITSIFLMGGLALIPKGLEDAAKVDGARSWMRFRRITLPLMLPTILVTLLFRSIDALRVFDIIYGLTGGGPGTTTEVLSSFAYRFYFSFNQYGAGSAYAIVTFFLVMAVSMVYIRQIAPRLKFRE